MTDTLSLVTYNIHKGFSQFNRRLMVHELRDRLRGLNPDLVFLQEVQGLHEQHAQKHANWPEQPQHEFLADSVWSATYGQNVLYDHGHHGNAILSRYPIEHSHNQDVTHLSFEKRGLLHTQISWQGTIVHCVCAHLSLLARSRKWQMAALAEEIDRLVPHDQPLIIAGDFNDWRNHASEHLADRLNLTEVFHQLSGRPARSFPVALPMLQLDRIYVRGLKAIRADVHYGAGWSRISDHAALHCELALTG